MKVAGLMSGTSLDGIDVALLQVEGTGPGDFRWSLEGFRTAPYSPAQQELIREAAEGRATTPEVARLHVYLGEWFAGALQELLEEVGVAPSEVAVVGSHGQTVRHDPPRGSERGFSLQLGDPATLAERGGVAVVSDLRARDLAAGGHGAPLVPRADLFLFHEPGRGRALQNLGGMGNVTWLPPSGRAEEVVGFDTGPGVALLDEAARRATGGKWRLDRDGSLARRGRVDEAVLARMLEDPFFLTEPPRSTGRERFGGSFLDRHAEGLLSSEPLKALPPEGEPGPWEDLLATLTALTARSVGDAYRRWVLPRGVDEIFLLGGGRRNPALVEALARELEGVPVKGGEALGMDPDAREAAAFAVLAWCHLRGEPGNLSQVTGARGERVLGSFTPA